MVRTKKDLKYSSMAWCTCWLTKKRKGASLIHHEQSNTLFLFGGIKKVTKEQNDVMVYVISQQKWVRIHSSTNDLYDPSPTLK